MTDPSDKDNPDSDNTNSDNIFREFIGNIKGFKKIDNTKHNPFDIKPTNIPSEKQADQAEHYHKKNTHHHNGNHHEHFSDRNNQAFQLSDHLWRPQVSAEENLFYFQQGVQYRTIRKLRAGKIRIESTLDLHQLNKEQARTEFSQFLQNCYDNEQRCICIIHGKGYRSSTNIPLLKNLVNHWLQDINIVLGFCSCPANLGGSGAVLILLKRNNN